MENRYDISQATYWFGFLHAALNSVCRKVTLCSGFPGEGSTQQLLLVPSGGLSLSYITSRSNIMIVEGKGLGNAVGVILAIGLNIFILWGVAYGISNLDNQPDLRTETEKCNDEGGRMRYYTSLDYMMPGVSRLSAEEFKAHVIGVYGNGESIKIESALCYKEAQTLFEINL